MAAEDDKDLASILLRLLFTRPDFGQRALALRKDPDALRAFLVGFFQFTNGAEQHRAEFIESCIETVNGAGSGTATSLYRTCLSNALSRNLRALIRAGHICSADELKHCLGLPRDFEEQVRSLQHNEDALRRFITAAFASAASGWPSETYSTLVDGVCRSILSHRDSQSEVVLWRCLFLVAELNPMKREVPSEDARQRVATVGEGSETYRGSTRPSSGSGL